RGGPGFAPEGEAATFPPVSDIAVTQTGPAGTRGVRLCEKRQFGGQPRGSSDRARRAVASQSAEIGDFVAETGSRDTVFRNPPRRTRRGGCIRAMLASMQRAPA